MPVLFLLDIDTDPAARCATLRLHDGNGLRVPDHQVALAAHPPARWEGLFDTRRHLAREEYPESPAEHLATLGRFLGEHVLGAKICAKLADGVHQRTVLVRLPDPAHDDLAASFARVPWELARAPGDDRTLLDRNVVVRVAPAGSRPGRETAIAPEAGKPLRALLVFAEAPGSRPLAARLERERLLDLLFGEVLPAWNVEVDVLCHGVTRRRLTEQVRSRGGYHLVHWSGHGCVDGLEIALDEGEAGKGWITGKGLVDLFSAAGGFIPPVMFLTAWLSGSVDLDGQDQDGFTGTALSLVRAGVKQVVAMRYEVGDRYTRRLARRFYRRLLADPAHHPVDAALALARKELTEDRRRADYPPLDHANPVVLGADPVRFAPEAAASAQMKRRAPRPQPLLQNGSRELDPPYGFVGRGRELTELGHRWLAAEGEPVALIQGLAGLGKTSLAAEAIHLWFDRFDGVFCFQAKGGALSIEEFFRRLDQRLTLASPSYRARCQANEMAGVYLAPTLSFQGPEREEALRNNLVDVLLAERILVVLDNFEKNLLAQGGPEYGAQDPAWDGLLETLGDRLRGSGSRVLVTSRHKPVALAGRALWIPLGPLPMDEARLFFEGQPSLRDLMVGDDDGRWLARRILVISRGHPLILARIADLARAFHDKREGFSAVGRAALGECLDRIEGEGFRALPDVFSKTPMSESDREKERAYLEEVAVGAVDLLLGRLSPNARTVLWVVTRAGEPVTEEMVAAAWGKSPALQLRELCGSGLVVREGEAYAFHELVGERAAAWVGERPGEPGEVTEEGVWTAYGEWYGALFKALRAEAKRDRASEAGQWGIRYLVRARALESLGKFASEVIIETRDPALLSQVIAELQAVVGGAPAGRERWSLRTCMADAMTRANQPDRALPFYAEAAKEAETAEHRSDLAWICQNWANALGAVGQLDRAREMYIKSAEAERGADKPPINVIICELEALRLDVKHGRAAEAILAVEAKLGEVRAWWTLHQDGKPVPETPNDEVLARALVSGLDVARDANHSLKRWQRCLDLLGELEQVQHAIGTGELDVARAHANRYAPLKELGKLAEAKAVLEDCIDVFHRTEAITDEATALSGLADFSNALGGPAPAIALERRALATRERLPNPEDRAASHNNLAGYLHADGATGEARAHQLASIAYSLAIGLDQRPLLQNLAIDIYASAIRGETFTFALLADLLADPAFAPLRAFLADRAIPTADLQARIDAVVARARAEALP